MENSPYPSNIHEKVKRVLRKSNKIVDKDEVICVCYLLSFLKYNNDLAFQRFKWNFQGLSDESKRNVISLCLKFQNKEKVNSKVKKK